MMIRNAFILLETLFSMLLLSTAMLYLLPRQQQIYQHAIWLDHHQFITRCLSNLSQAKMLARSADPLQYCLPTPQGQLSHHVGGQLCLHWRRPFDLQEQLTCVKPN